MRAGSVALRQAGKAAEADVGWKLRRSRVYKTGLRDKQSRDVHKPEESATW